MDIVERLREYNEPPFDYIAHEAAAKIENLRFAWDTTSAECNKLIIEIEQLREVLSTVLEACEDVNSPDRKVRREIARPVGKALKALKERA